MKESQATQLLANAASGQNGDGWLAQTWLGCATSLKCGDLTSFSLISVLEMETEGMGIPLNRESAGYCGKVKGREGTGAWEGIGGERVVGVMVPLREAMRLVDSLFAD